MTNYADPRSTRRFFNSMQKGIEDIQQSRPDLTRLEAAEKYRQRHQITREWKSVPGRIGNGTKVHLLDALHFTQGGVVYLGNVNSFCGSAKWSASSTSALTVLPEDTEVTCRKCRR